MKDLGLCSSMVTVIRQKTLLHIYRRTVANSTASAQGTISRCMIRSIVLGT
jgi:hypothetical protein